MLNLHMHIDLLKHKLEFTDHWFSKYEMNEWLKWFKLFTLVTKSRLDNYNNNNNNNNNTNLGIHLKGDKKCIAFEHLWQHAPV